VILPNPENRESDSHAAIRQDKGQGFEQLFFIVYIDYPGFFLHFRIVAVFSQKAIQVRGDRRGNLPSETTLVL